MRRLLSTAGPLALALLAPVAAAAQPILLPEVVLSPNRTPEEAIRTGSSVSVLTGPQLERDGRPFALQQITDLPGVTVQQNGPAGTVSGFAIRGAPQSYVRVEVDGIEISDMTAPQVSPSLSGLLVDDISRIEVLKGSQSAVYGGQAVGGLIAITSPRATAPGIENRLILEGGEHSTFRGSWTLAGLGPQGEFALNASRLQTDGFSAAEERDGNSERDGYTTTRLSASGRFNATEAITFFGAGFWQDEDGDYDETVNGRPVDARSTFDARNYGLRGGLEYLTAGGITHLFALGYFDIDRTNDARHPVFGPSTYRTRGDRTRAEYRGAMTPNEALAVGWGADYAVEDVRTRFSSPFGVSTASEDTWIAGAFVQSTWSPRPDLVIDAAARADEHSEFGFYPTGRLTLAWLPQPETTIRGSLGTGFRAPSAFELYDPFSGNRDLDPEKSVSADLGVARRFGAGRGEASATVFWLEIDDLIEFDPATFVYVQANGKARSRGVELAAAWTFAEALTLTGAYTYTDAEGADGERRNRIPRNEIALAATGTVAERVGYDVNARLVWDYKDDSAADFLGNVIDSRGWSDDFVVVNARLAYFLTDRAEVYVRAENLFDETYQTARGYTAPGRTFYAGVAARF